MQVGDGQCEGGDHGREREVVGNRARMKTWRLHTLHDSSTEPGRSATYKKRKRGSGNCLRMQSRDLQESSGCRCGHAPSLAWHTSIPHRH